MLSGLGSVLVLAGPAGAVTPPTVTSVSPTSGPATGGTRISVYGTGFSHIDWVGFGHLKGLSVQVVASTHLWVTAPAEAAGTVDVRVHSSVTGISPAHAADHYTYLSTAPAVSGISPATGSYLGGTVVNVYGANFTPTSTVTFDGVPGTAVSVLNPNHLTVTSPAHAPGVVYIHVTASGSTSPATFANAYTYVHGPVTPVSAATATAASSTTVTLSWTASPEADVASVIVRRNAGATAPLTATDGTLVLAVPVTTNTVTDVGLAHGTEYSYSLFASTADGLTSSPVVVRTSTLAVAFPAGVSDMNPAAGGPRVLSCEGSMCMEGDAHGAAYAMLGGVWSKTDVPPGGGNFTAVSCTSSGPGCFAVDGQGNFFRWLAGTWVDRHTFSSDPNAQFVALSCPDASWCMAADASGKVVIYDGEYASPATTVTTPLPAGGNYPILSLSCASPTFCVANDGRGVAWLYDGSSWSGQQLNTDGGIGTISCPSATRCVGLDNADNEFRWTASGWKVFPTPLHGLGKPSISCPTVTFCGVVAADGAAMTWNGSWWVATATGGPDIAKVVSCSTSSLCIALDQDGGELRFDGTSWRTGSWVDPPHGGVTDLSCAGADFCAAVAGSDALVGQGSPFAFAPPQRIAGYATLRSISCVSSTFCVALGDDGAYTYDGAGWSGPVGIASGGYTLVSCVSATFCAADDPAAGGFAIYDGTTWTVSTATASLFRLTCVTSTFCAGIDSANDVETWNGSAWSTVPPTSSYAGFHAISCPSAGTCWLVDASGRPWELLGGSLLSAQTIGGFSGSNAISCPAATFCLAVDTQSRIATYNGSAWSAGSSPVFGEHALNLVSCTTAGLCLLVDNEGLVSAASV